MVLKVNIAPTDSRNIQKRVLKYCTEPLNCQASYRGCGVEKDL